MPNPDQPSGSYQGRPLPRPDDEVVDQGLGFDIATLFSRRRVLAVFGAGAATAGLAACGATADPSGGSSSAAAGTPNSEGEIPDETAGPYPGDGSNGPDALEQSGIVRSDIRSSFDTGSATAEGVPMDLELTILDLANNSQPFEGVAVYVWHCTREGEYSMYADGLEDENFLRGVQIADAEGKVKFTSIFPACYSGRWPHIHFEVYPDQDSITDAENAIAISQVALPKTVCDTVYKVDGYEQSASNLSQVSLDSDNVFGDDGGESQLAEVTGSVKKGYQVSLTAGVDTDTEVTGGSAPSGGMPGGQGGPGEGGPGGQGGTPPEGAPTGAPPEGAPSGAPPQDGGASDGSADNQ